MQSSLESVQATVAARELALKRLEAAQSKADVGMATNYEVVQAQRDFADARNAELRAVLNYRKAIVNFDTVQRVGTRGVGAVGGGANGVGHGRRRRPVTVFVPTVYTLVEGWKGPRSGLPKHS